MQRNPLSNNPVRDMVLYLNEISKSVYDQSRLFPFFSFFHCCFSVMLFPSLITQQAFRANLWSRHLPRAPHAPRAPQALRSRRPTRQVSRSSGPAPLFPKRPSREEEKEKRETNSPSSPLRPGSPTKACQLCVCAYQRVGPRNAVARDSQVGRRREGDYDRD